MEGRLEALEEAQSALHKEMQQYRDESLQLLQTMMEQLNGLTRVIKNWVSNEDKAKDPIGTSSSKSTPENPNERGNKELINKLMLARGLNLSTFDGAQLDSWLFKAERYFDLCSFTEEEKLQAAALFMEGEALTWFRFEESRFEESRQPFRTWTELKEKLLWRFQPNRLHLMQRFHELRQYSTVAEYRRRFEEFAVTLGHMGEVLLRAVFVRGLRDDIVDEIEPREGPSLDEIITRAQVVEINRVQRVQIPPLRSKRRRKRKRAIEGA